MLEHEKLPLYNEQGQVADPRVAEEMAYTEKPYREDEFGPILRYFRTVKSGERLAEKIGELVHNMDNAKIMRLDESESRKFFPQGAGTGIKFHIDGDEIAMFFQDSEFSPNATFRDLIKIGESVAARIVVNGQELDSVGAGKLFKLFKPLVRREEDTENVALAERGRYIKRRTQEVRRQQKEARARDRARAEDILKKL